MTMNDESWHVIRNITGVTGFVGPGSKPVPLTDEEVEAFNIELRVENVAFAVGDKVSIVSGMFEGYHGTITDISEDKKTVNVLVSTETRDITIMVDSKDIRVID